MKIRVLVLSILAFLFLYHSEAEAINIIFKKNVKVGLCCLKPESRAVFMGVVWSGKTWVPLISVVRGEATVAPDREKAWWRPSTGVPTQSYWLGIDLGRGDYATASRFNSGVQEKDLSPDNLQRNEKGDIVAFDVPSSFVEAIVLRPGVGAWALTAGDGGASDGDGRRNATTRLVLSEAKKIGDAPKPPGMLALGDMIFAVALHTGEIYTITIAD